MIRKIQSGSLSVFWQFFIHFQFGTLFLGQIFISIQALSSPSTVQLWWFSTAFPEAQRPPQSPQKAARRKGVLPAALQAASPLCVWWEVPSTLLYHGGTVPGHHWCPENWAGLCLSCPCWSFSEYWPPPPLTPGVLSPCSWTLVCQVAPWDLLLWICAVPLGLDEAYMSLTSPSLEPWPWSSPSQLCDYPDLSCPFGWDICEPSTFSSEARSPNEGVSRAMVPWRL